MGGSGREMEDREDDLAEAQGSLQHPEDDGRLRVTQGHQDVMTVDNETCTGFSHKVLTLMRGFLWDSQTMGIWEFMVSDSR